MLFVANPHSLFDVIGPERAICYGKVHALCLLKNLAAGFLWQIGQKGGGQFEVSLFVDACLQSVT